jgi:hypothetical protein
VSKTRTVVRAVSITGGGNLDKDPNAEGERLAQAFAEVGLADRPKLAKALGHVVALLEYGPRTGELPDEPEGTAIVSLSHTLALQLAKGIREGIEGL